MLDTTRGLKVSGHLVRAVITLGFVAHVAACAALNRAHEGGGSTAIAGNMSTASASLTSPTSPEADRTGQTGGPIFGTPQGKSFRFPGKRRSSEESVYWRVTGHSAGRDARDMSLIRFNHDTGRWTAKRADGTSQTLGTPVYAMADGEVFSCWRNAPDGDDPGRDGCDGTCDKFDECSCTTPAGGNHVRIRTEDNLTLFHAHLQEGSVPSDLCPINLLAVNDAKDKSGPYGLIPEIVVPQDQRATVKAGDFIGFVGNSGKSSGPHLHIHVRQCGPDPETESCSVQPLHLNAARIAKQPQDRDVSQGEWIPLNGTLPVTTPVHLVLPDSSSGGFDPDLPVAEDPTDQIDLVQLGENASATIIVDATNPAAPVGNFDWERVEPSLTQLRFDANIRWHVSASCADGIDRVSMVSSGANETEDFAGNQNTVLGEFETQSFTAEALEEICLDWAASVSDDPICNQAPEFCPSHEDFDLAGGITPSLVDDVVEVTLLCQNGTTVVTTGRPELSLRCGAVPFGFPH